MDGGPCLSPLAWPWARPEVLRWGGLGSLGGTVGSAAWKGRPVLPPAAGLLWSLPLPALLLVKSSIVAVRPLQSLLHVPGYFLGEGGTGC